MTLSEFKAWFEGFTEDLDGAPSEKQWDRIKGRVAEITGQSVTYVPQPVRAIPWVMYPNNGSLLYGASQFPPQNMQAYQSADRGSTRNSHAALTALGKADAAALAA